MANSYFNGDINPVDRNFSVRSSTCHKGLIFMTGIAAIKVTSDNILGTEECVMKSGVASPHSGLIQELFYLIFIKLENLSG